MSTLEIESITVVRGMGADHVMLHLNLPDGCWPYTGKATANMSVAAGGAEEYLAKHFAGTPFSLVESNKGSYGRAVS